MGVFSRFGSFPVELIIFRRYQNALKPKTYRARFIKKMVQTEDGAIERKNVEYLDGNKTMRLPNFNLPELTLVEGKQTLMLLQVDLSTYLPIVYQDGLLKIQTPKWKVVQRPVLDLDEKGIPKRDENGKEILLGYQEEFERDSSGNLVQDGYEERILFNPYAMLEDGKIVTIPQLTAKKTYDREQWLSGELELANKTYKSKNFWVRNREMILLLCVGFLMIMALYVTFSQLNNGLNAVALQNQAIADANRQIADKLAQIARVTPIPNAPA